MKFSWGFSRSGYLWTRKANHLFLLHLSPRYNRGARQVNSKTLTHLGGTNWQTSSIYRRGEILLGRQCESALLVVEDIHSMVRPWFSSLGEISSFVVLQSSHSFVHHSSWWHLGRVLLGRTSFWEPHNFHSLLPIGMIFPSQNLLSQLILPLASNFLKNFGRSLNYCFPSVPNASNIIQGSFQGMFSNVLDLFFLFVPTSYLSFNLITVTRS